MYTYTYIHIYTYIYISLTFQCAWDTNTFEQSACVAVKCHLDFKPNHLIVL